MSVDSKRRPKVSIVMPFYNQEKYLDECILSVVKQTLSDIEIILVNDGSTDKSLQIAKRFAKLDKRIQLIDKANSGYGNSVNIGLNKATGEYIGIVETDDIIASTMYEKLYELTQHGTIDLVKGNFYDYYCNEDGTKHAIVNEERIKVPENIPCNVRTEQQILWGHPSVWSAIYKRSMLEDNHIRFIEAKGGGWVDNPFFFETLFVANKYIWTNEPLYYYRKTNADSSSNRITNPILPFERMLDNLEVAERNHFTDFESLKYLYSRALMYMIGARFECDYAYNFEIIDKYAKELMRKCHSDVFDSEFNISDRFEYHTNASPIKTMLYDAPKILIYNWAPFDNEQVIGGGVTVYCKNLVETILKESPSTQVYFLSSGFSYDATRTDTYVKSVNSIYNGRVHQFEVVNSPVPADQWLLYRNPTIAFESKTLKNLVKEFIDTFGEFKAIYFNNIEGLSLDVLDLKDHFPNSKFVYAIHNYNSMCLTGFYFQRHNHCICNPNHTAQDCFECSRVNISKNAPALIYQRAKMGVEQSKCIVDSIWLDALGIDRLFKDAESEQLVMFAKLATDKINKNCDCILAVSKRVYDIAVDNGYDISKLYVAYIGTKVARGQIGHSITNDKGFLRLVFLGNDLNLEEKGYPFLLNALSKLDKKYAANIELVLTTRSKNYEKIYTMLPNYKSIKVYNGYTYKDLKKILEGCDLSIVPVLWEDNLPQIAIESVAYGVPVLASDAGGASELCNSSMFKFEHGNTDDFLDKLTTFIEHPELIQEYWQHHHGLVTLEEHWNELNSKYFNIEDVSITLSKQDLATLLQENSFLKQNFSGEVKYVNMLPPEDAELLRIAKELDLSPDSKYFKLIRKLNRMFPKNTKRRRFLKSLLTKRR